MPRGQPFTLLCQQTARLVQPRAADLHAHTTASDGDYTPSQLVMLAAQARLAAIAVTDHDTVAAVPEALAAAQGITTRRVEVVAGVEASATFGGRGYHILGLFVDPEHAQLREELATVCERRRERFRAYLDHFARNGVTLADGLAALVEQRSASLGRRHLAGLLVSAGVVATWYAAFERYIRPAGEQIAVSHALSAERVLKLVRDAGGVSSLAHPPEDIAEADLAALRDLGLNAVEAYFPAATPPRTAALLDAAGRLGLGVSGGSDCHGPEPAGRAVGARGVTRDELAALRALAP